MAKITANGIVLCSGIGKENPINLRINTDFKFQVSMPIRATYGRVFPRFAKLTQISFQVSREHESPSAAEMFCFTHADSLPVENNGSPYLIAITSTSSSGSISSRTLEGLITRASGEHTGASSLFSYEIMGGKISIPT